MSAELKSCPFCGASKAAYTWREQAGTVVVECRFCGVRTNSGETESEVAELWNTRARLREAAPAVLVAGAGDPGFGDTYGAVREAAPAKHHGDPICIMCASQQEGPVPTKCTCGKYPAPAEEVGALVERLLAAGDHYGIPIERDCAEAADALSRLQARVEELHHEARLFDEDNRDNLALIDRIADLIGLPDNEELDQINFVAWFDAAERRVADLEREPNGNDFGWRSRAIAAESSLAAAALRERAMREALEKIVQSDMGVDTTGSVVRAYGDVIRMALAVLNQPAEEAK